MIDSRSSSGVPRVCATVKELCIHSLWKTDTCYIQAAFFGCGGAANISCLPPGSGLSARSGLHILCSFSLEGNPTGSTSHCWPVQSANKEGRVGVGGGGGAQGQRW